MKFKQKILKLCLCFLSLCLSLFANEASSEKDHWDGEKYLNNSDLQYQWARTYIKKLQLQGNEKILDIGCGDGRITALLAKAVPQGFVIGVDTSESMLQMALKLLQVTCPTNLAFAKADAVNLPFVNEFDQIVSFSTFHWIRDHLAALQEMENSLKPGGKIFLYFAPDHGRDRFDHSIKSVRNSEKWAHYFTDFSNPFSLITPSKFAVDAEEAHLLIKRIEIITVDEIFSDRAAFIAWMTGWMSYLKKLPKELHEEFLNEIIDCYLEKHPLDAQGKIHYIDYWMEAELLKPT